MSCMPYHLVVIYLGTFKFKIICIRKKGKQNNAKEAKETTWNALEVLRKLILHIVANDTTYNFISISTCLYLEKEGLPITES